MKSIKDENDSTTIEQYYTTFVEASEKRNKLGEENDYTSMMKKSRVAKSWKGYWKNSTKTRKNN